MEILSALKALWTGNPPITNGFLSQRATIQVLDVFYVLLARTSLLNKPSSCWSFETTWCSRDVTSEKDLNLWELLPNSAVLNYAQIDGLVQDRCTSSALALELRLSCTNTMKSSLPSKHLKTHAQRIFMFHDTSTDSYWPITFKTDPNLMTRYNWYHIIIKHKGFGSVQTSSATYPAHPHTTGQGFPTA